MSNARPHQQQCTGQHKLCCDHVQQHQAERPYTISLLLTFLGPLVQNTRLWYSHPSLFPCGKAILSPRESQSEYREDVPGVAVRELLTGVNHDVCFCRSLVDVIGRSQSSWSVERHCSLSLAKAIGGDPFDRPQSTMVGLS